VLCWCLLWARLSWERQVATAATHVRPLVMNLEPKGPAEPGLPREQLSRTFAANSAEDLFNVVDDDTRERLQAAFRAVNQTCSVSPKLDELRQGQVACMSSSLKGLLQLVELVDESRRATDQRLRAVALVGIGFSIAQLACALAARRAASRAARAHAAASDQVQQIKSRLETVIQDAYDATFHVEAAAPFKVISSAGRLGPLQAMDKCGKSILAFAGGKIEEEKLSRCLQAMAAGGGEPDSHPAAACPRFWWKDTPCSCVEVSVTLVETGRSPSGGPAICLAVRQLGSAKAVAAAEAPGLRSLASGAAGTASTVTMSADLDTRRLVFLNLSPSWARVLQERKWNGLIALLTADSRNMLQSKIIKLLRSKEEEAVQCVLVKFARHQGVGLIRLRRRAVDPSVVRMELEMRLPTKGLQRAALPGLGANLGRAVSEMEPTPLMQCEQMLCDVVRHCNFEIPEGCCCTFHAGLAFVQKAVRSMSSEDCAAFSGFRVAEGWQCPMCAALNDDELQDDPSRPCCRTCFGCGEDTGATASP